MLEKILQEIEKESYSTNTDYGYSVVVNMDSVARIICSYMEDDGWIPVEEGCPTEKGWYQCTCDDRRTGGQIWKNHTLVRELFWNPSINEFIDNIRYAENGHKNQERYSWTKYVTAWRPLHEPYCPKKENG